MLNRLLSAQCVLCNSYSRLTVCEPCLQDLPWVKHQCQSCHCATSAPTEFCSGCQNHPESIYSRFAPLFYDEPIKNLMWQFKFGEQLHLSRTFAELIRYAYPMHQAKPDLLLPVPLHPKRIQQRGFNQSIEIAKRLQELMDIPYDWRAFTRLKHTEAQHKLTQAKRKVNLNDVFALTQCPQVQHIAIVDDVVTTGETTRVLANLLRGAGVPKVSIWAVAQTVNW